MTRVTRRTVLAALASAVVVSAGCIEDDGPEDTPERDAHDIINETHRWWWERRNPEIERRGGA